MGKKHRAKRLPDPGKAEEFRVNPFSHLDLDLPEEPQDEFPKAKGAEETHVHLSPEDKRAQLNPEDTRLLHVFTRGESVGSVKGLAVSLAVERKGRGGKTVTVLRGLADIDVLDQMEICRQLRAHLGTGGRFHEGVLELQGDQRKRAGEWLQAQGYRVRGA